VADFRRGEARPNGHTGSGDRYDLAIVGSGSGAFAAAIAATERGCVIYAGVLAVRFHLTVRDLTDTFAPYLTMSEGFKLAAQSFTRDPSKLSCCSA